MEVKCLRCGSVRPPGQYWRNYCYQGGCSGWHEKELVKKRRLSISRFNKCIFCDKEKDIEIHHIDKNQKNNKKDNLLVLCIHCHRILHSKIYKKICPN